jgi:Fanconi anemia group M protein
MVRRGISLKEVGDFLESLIDGRLFSQVRSLSSTFERPLIIIEGDGLYTLRNIRPEAVRGALASIMVDFGVPVFITSGPQETADLLLVIARS